jgi:hypothetical protein
MRDRMEKSDYFVNQKGEVECTQKRRKFNAGKLTAGWGTLSGYPSASLASLNLAIPAAARHKTRKANRA